MALTRAASSSSGMVSAPPVNSAGDVRMAPLEFSNVVYRKSAFTDVGHGPVAAADAQSSMAVRRIIEPVGVELVG